MKIMQHDHYWYRCVCSNQTTNLSLNSDNSFCEVVSLTSGDNEQMNECGQQETNFSSLTWSSVYKIVSVIYDHTNSESNNNGCKTCIALLYLLELIDQISVTITIYDAVDKLQISRKYQAVEYG